MHEVDLDTERTRRCVFEVSTKEITCSTRDAERRFMRQSAKHEAGQQTQATGLGGTQTEILIQCADKHEASRALRTADLGSESACEFIVWVFTYSKVK